VALPNRAICTVAPTTPDTCNNGIEHALMAAYAEGLSVLRSANVGKTESSIDAEATPLRDPEHTISMCVRSRRSGAAAV
jgi:hypothetical protein